MPELPEVQTTVSGLKKVLPGLKILDVWTDLAVKKPSLRHYDDTIKNLKFFKPTYISNPENSTWLNKENE